MHSMITAHATFELDIYGAALYTMFFNRIAYTTHNHVIVMQITTLCIHDKYLSIVTVHSSNLFSCWCTKYFDYLLTMIDQAHRTHDQGTRL
jgi:hypothetical protein